ncbi:hypothetical protein GW7_19059 [Heterocephalus glaber]|uniref:Uncharacterized protein n=1 Tax=Heterocephalus glaber TaxID=10181 RepID=G5BXR8_HETGA|nr:hypothetical protein GW7_19059 [Heterocephalus glaber]
MWVWLAALQAGGAGGKPTPEQREEGRRGQDTAVRGARPGPCFPSPSSASQPAWASLGCGADPGVSSGPLPVALSGGAGGASVAAVTPLPWVPVLRPARTKALAPPVAPPRFVERPDFFDYPDSDQASLQAVAQFIGERPVQFVHSGSGPGLFHHILVGILVVAFFYLLFQFCIHV